LYGLHSRANIHREHRLLSYKRPSAVLVLLWGVLDITLCDKVCQWLTAGRWFSSCTPVSSTNKIDHHDITEILLKVANRKFWFQHFKAKQYVFFEIDFRNCIFRWNRTDSLLLVQSWMKNQRLAHLNLYFSFTWLFIHCLGSCKFWEIKYFLYGKMLA
jgi:hypothetical protein